MTRRVPLVHALVASAFLGSCSPANVGGLDAGTSPIDGQAPELDAGLEGGADSVKAVCQDYGYAYCNQLQACSSTDLQGRFGTPTTCRAVIAALCANQINAPSSGASIATSEACTKAVPMWACVDFLNNESRPPACSNIAGSLPKGAACGVSQQCQSAFCALPPGSACGTCGDLPKAGDSCANTECPSGLACVANVCALYAQEGASCSTTQPCNAGLTCVGSPGTCEPGVTTMGAPCSFAGAGCDMTLGLTCNAQSGTCEVAEVVQPGHACGTVANQSVYCLAGICPRGQCVAMSFLGEPCDLVAGPECGPPLRCTVSADGGTAGTCLASGSSTCR